MIELRCLIHLAKEVNGYSKKSCFQEGYIVALSCMQGKSTLFMTFGKKGEGNPATAGPFAFFGFAGSI